jgi:hypothetical protein
MATDSTQFLIDIAAKLTGGEASVAVLADLGDRMLKAGATAAELEKTVKTTSDALEQNGAALKVANDAVTEGQKRYDSLEVAADKAAKTLEKLNASGKTGDAFTKKQAEAATKVEETSAALKAEAVALDAVKTKAAAAAASNDALSKGLKNVKGAAEQATKAEKEAKGSGKVNEIAEALGKLGGPAGVAGQKLFGLAGGFQKMRAAMGTVGPYLAIGVGIVAIAAAAIAATFAITNWGVGLADANRTQGLLLDGIARTSKGGAQLADAIDNLGTKVPYTSDELTGMASKLADTGLRGKDLTSALERTAVAAAKLKFGPDFAAAMLSLDFQAKKLKENISATFGGLKIDKLLEGLQTLGALFDAGTASGRALKFVFESLFQPVVDGAAGAATKVERFFLQAEILALRAFIAIKPYRGEIEAVGKALLIGAAAITAVVVGTFVVLAAAIGAVVYIVGLLVSKIPAAGEALGDAAFAIVQFFATLPQKVAELGAELVQGLVNGITGGATAVVNAMTGVVTGGIDAAKNLLGIASPSKVFEGIGGHTAAGFAAGVEGGASDAQGALEAMVAPPATGAGGGRGGMGNITIQISVEGRGESDDGLAAKIAAAVRDVFESDALTLGGGEVPA